jgi:hypothetical protein
MTCLDKDGREVRITKLPPSEPMAVRDMQQRDGRGALRERREQARTGAAVLSTPRGFHDDGATSAAASAALEPGNAANLGERRTPRGARPRYRTQTRGPSTTSIGEYRGH